MIAIDMNLLKDVKLVEFEELLTRSKPVIWHANDNKKTQE
jgi:hypothetical protein